MWAHAWLTKVADNTMVLISELVQALGRLQFVYTTLKYDHPILAPIYTLACSGHPLSCMTLPVHVRTVMRWLAARILKRRKQQCALKIQMMGELM